MKIDKDLIQQCDSDIRSGHSLRVAQRLAKLNIARVERPWRLPLAKICRRAGLLSIGLELLNPLVHGRFKDGQSASAAELAEYGVLLMRYGAVSEAVALLQKLDSSVAPEALLYRSYALFINWEFESAIPLLQQYLIQPLSSYNQSVGQTNLAFALTESRRHGDALRLTEEIIKATQSEGNLSLQGTCRALRAQVFVQERDFQTAREEIKRGEALHSLSPSNDHFLLKKWGLILEGLESKRLAPFNELRRLAIQSHNWEAWREADMFSLLVHHSEELFVHLYFGSPIPGLRERMKVELGGVPKRTVYVLGAKDSPRFDLRTGQIGGETVVKPGKKEHQLLQVLLKDFYRPLRIGGLFAELFPNEHFDLISSPVRVHQILRRTRGLLKKVAAPVGIDEANEYYSLNLSGPFSFRLTLDGGRTDSMESQFERIRSSCGENRPFSVRDLRERMGISEATAHRLIKWGIANARLERTGKLKRSLLFKVKPKDFGSAA